MQALLEWEYLAAVLDRWLLISFCGAVISIMSAFVGVGVFKDQGFNAFH